MRIFIRYLFSQFIFLFGIIWALVGTIFFLIGITSWISEYEVQKYGVAAEATLVEKIHRSGRENSSIYILKYLYRDARENEHIRESQVNWETWRRFEDGDKLPIIYVPGDPSKSRLGGGLEETEWVIALVFTLIGAVFGGIGWALVVLAFIRVHRIGDLFQKGLVAQGEITGLEKDWSTKINGRHPTFFRYRFTGPDGAAHEGKSPNLPLKWEGRWKPGDPVSIVYDPENPDRSEADIHGLRKAG